MMNKRSIFSSIKGLTVIELVIALVILALVLSIAYPVINMFNNTTNNELKGSAQRTDVRSASSYLTDDIRYSRAVSSSGQSITIIDKDGVSVQYLFKTDAGGNTYLVRQKGGASGSISEFKEIRNANFINNGGKLVDISLVTDTLNNIRNDFKVYRLQQLPFKSLISTFGDFLKNNGVFVFSNNFDMPSGGGNQIDGPDGAFFLTNSTSGDTFTMQDGCNLKVKTRTFGFNFK